MRALRERINRRQQTRRRIIGGRHLHTVHIQRRLGAQARTHIDARRVVVRGRRRAVGIGDRTKVVVIAGRRRRLGWRRGIHLENDRVARRALVTGRIRHRVGDGMGTFREWIDRGQGTGCRIIGRRNLHTVHVQRRRVGQAGANVNTWGPVVGNRGVAA